MKSDAKIRAVPPVNLPKLALMRAESPPLHFYRYLYDAIGRDYYWIDRPDITDDALAELDAGTQPGPCRPGDAARRADCLCHESGENRERWHRP